MPELLFEIGTEELPSWYVTQAGEALPALLREKLAEAGLAHGELTAFATPRRLAVHVADVASTTTERTERRRGPAVAVAFDADGKPTRAVLGFAAANGVDASELITEETERGAYVFAVRRVGGEAAAEVLPALLAALIRELPAPRKMRWGDVETPFVRPIAWLLARLDDQVLPLREAGVEAVGHSYGHRFLAPGPVAIATPASYREALRDAKVIAEPTERDLQTWEAAVGAAASKELQLLEDAALRSEVVNLVEYPVAVLGSFAEEFLELPEEVLITVMIHHQRFFPTRTADGKLAPHFVSISNNEVEDVEVVRRGYQQVLAGRLFDARFFWQSDRRKSLSQHAWGLSGIGFHRRLGSLADKVARAAEGARALAELLALPEDERAALEQALPIFRADASTEMVFEFPELEGVMARLYALAEGLEPMVAQALEDGLRPKGPGAPLPETEIGAVLAVADRGDKLLGFFALGSKPSGSADPFALRRDATAMARILTARGWPVSVDAVLAAAAAGYLEAEGAPDVEVDEAVIDEVEAFIWDRVISLLHDEGVPVTVVRAATADRPPLVTAARRAHLLLRLQQAPGFTDLMTLYKRAANLAKNADELPGGPPKVDPERFVDPHEQPLYAALPAARAGLERMLTLVEEALPPWDLGSGPGRELPDLAAEVAAVLELKEPLDAFLDNVLVMVDDEAVRTNRLALLREVRDALRALGHLEELASG